MNPEKPPFSVDRGATGTVREPLGRHSISDVSFAL